MIAHFGELTGVPYPWNKYAQVVVSDFIFGGMENTTATTMYEHILLDERAALDITSDDLIAHELAHQWFGDYVTCRDWSHGWLNEGFATFMEHVDREARLGRDEYEYGAARRPRGVPRAKPHGRYRRPIVCQDYEAPIDLFDRHLYEKGGLVLHMLRTELGDTLLDGVNTYLTRHARASSRRAICMRALEEVSGRSLERFFEQWVYRPGHPELEVKVEHDDGVLSLAREADADASTSDGAPLSPSRPHASTSCRPRAPGRYARTRLVDKADVTVRDSVRDARPRFVVVDPELARARRGAASRRRATCCARSSRARPRRAGDGWPRTLLGKTTDPASIAALAAALAERRRSSGACAPRPRARSATRALDEAFDALSHARTTKHPKVRRAVVHALGRFRTHEGRRGRSSRCALRDASYLVEAEAARALGKTRAARGVRHAGRRPRSPLVGRRDPRRRARRPRRLARRTRRAARPRAHALRRAHPRPPRGDHRAAEARRAIESARGARRPARRPRSAPPRRRRARARRARRREEPRRPRRAPRARGRRSRAAPHPRNLARPRKGRQGRAATAARRDRQAHGGPGRDARSLGENRGQDEEDENREERS